MKPSNNSEGDQETRTAMEKKYKVIFERPNCIGAGSCAATFPERWVMSQTEDKADLVGGTKNKDSTVELEITLKELEDFKSSAQVCPVNVIHIIDVETGEKVV